MSTLVVHPADTTTDFLIELYEGIENKMVIRDYMTVDELAVLIRAAEQVIMCGHGSSRGLICGMHFIVTEGLVDVLRMKNNSIFLWCNASDFVMEHKLCGIFSGMFISEVGEAHIFGINTTQSTVDESNRDFAHLLKRELLSKVDIMSMHRNMISEYGALAINGNEIAAFNCARWYARSNLSTEVIVHKNCIYFRSVHPHTLTWSGGCRVGGACDICYAAARKISPSYYYCSACSWDICRECLALNIVDGVEDLCIHNSIAPAGFTGDVLELGHNSTNACHDEVGSNHSYPLQYEAGHMFLSLPEGCFLVDTGSPSTFGVTDRISYGPHIKTIPNRSMEGVTIESLRGIPAVYERVKGVLGMDVMSTQTVLWDGPNGCCTLGEDVDPVAVKVPLQFIASYISLTVEIMGVRRQCLFDTGAQYGYVLNADILSGAAPCDVIHDYNPLMGSIVSDSWTADVTIGGLHVSERFGVLSGLFVSALQLIGVEGILGVSWMANKKIWFAPHENAIYIC
jgi:hypothetical protein